MSSESVSRMCATTLGFRLLLISIICIVLCHVFVYRNVLQIKTLVRSPPSPMDEMKNGVEAEPPRVSYINDLIGSAGSGTKELRGASLWGVAPFFRLSPSPDTVLSMKGIQPTVCWAFSGSKGELHIYLPSPGPVRSISVEHIKPDKAKSAPRLFKLTGIIEDDIDIELLKDEYRLDGPALQFFHNKAVYDDDFTEVIFEVLSNHGNTEYTCIYKIHLYDQSMEYVHY